LGGGTGPHAGGVTLQGWRMALGPDLAGIVPYAAGEHGTGQAGSASTAAAIPEAAAGGPIYRGSECFSGPPVKTLKLAIFIFILFLFQIWFQKYYISSDGNQFLINKHKNRGRFLFTGAPEKHSLPPIYCVPCSSLPNPGIFFLDSFVWTLPSTCAPLAPCSPASGWLSFRVPSFEPAFERRRMHPALQSIMTKLPLTFRHLGGGFRITYLFQMNV
jgi:hypothetical protein